MLIHAWESVECSRVRVWQPGIGYVLVVIGNAQHSGGQWISIGEECSGEGDGDGPNDELRAGHTGNDTERILAGVMESVCEEGGNDGGDGNPGGLQCWWEYGTIEISYDGGLTWEEWWTGWYKYCEDGTLEVS